MKNKITAIILAAGQGKRMNLPVAKQFLILRDKPVLYYSLKVFEESSVDNIIVVTGNEQLDFCKENVIDCYHFSKVSSVIVGGKERYDSVYQALQNAKDADYVLIHDAARPFISVELIENVIQEVLNSNACVVGTPVKDTIKVVDGENNIVSTPSRDTLWSAQTPQAFGYASLYLAYQSFFREEMKQELGITDDAMVYERYLKRPVKMILGDYHNIKLTTPEDLLMAETILNRLLYEKTKKIEQFF